MADVNINKCVAPQTEAWYSLFLLAIFSHFIVMLFDDVSFLGFNCDNGKSGKSFVTKELLINFNSFVKNKIVMK
jgi:hypothetical protein